MKNIFNIIIVLLLFSCASERKELLQSYEKYKAEVKDISMVNLEGIKYIKIDKESESTSFVIQTNTNVKRLQYTFNDDDKNKVPVISDSIDSIVVEIKYLLDRTNFNSVEITPETHLVIKKNLNSVCYLVCFYKENIKNRLEFDDYSGFLGNIQKGDNNPQSPYAIRIDSMWYYIELQPTI